MEVKQLSKALFRGHGGPGTDYTGSEAHTDGEIQEHMVLQDRASRPGLTTLAFLDAGRDRTQELRARKRAEDGAL